MNALEIKFYIIIYFTEKHQRNFFEVFMNDAVPDAEKKLYRANVSFVEAKKNEASIFIFQTTD